MTTTVADSLLWWEHDAEAFVGIQVIAAPFFDNPSNEFFVVTEDFASSLEQVWAIMEGEA
jgi:hypothetical protein